jgi:hypothetical protein
MWIRVLAWGLHYRKYLRWEGMRMEKTRLGFRFFYNHGRNGNSPEYAHPTYEFYKIEDYKYSSEWTRSDTKLLEIETQTDIKRGHSIFRSYGMSVSHAEFKPEAIKIMNAILKVTEKFYGNPNRVIVKAIKALKIDRLDYVDFNMVPWKYRKQADLWIKAFKAGLKIEKMV